MTLNEHISMTFRDENTFESALESSEFVLLDKTFSGSKSGNLISHQGMFKNQFFGAIFKKDNKARYTGGE